MKVTLPAVLCLIATAACTQDETVAAYGASGQVWQLQSIDGKPFGARATIEFNENGRVGGQAPCNSWFAVQSAPYPWFDVTAIGASRRACPELTAEGQFFRALEAMTLSEVSGNVLILTNDTGGEMIFAPR